MKNPHDPGFEPVLKLAEPVIDAAADPIRVAGGGEVRTGTASWTDPTMIAKGVFYPDSVKTAEERNDLKEAVKAALIEVLHEREDLLREALTEALEEIGLIRAMEEAEDSPVVNREKIDRLLKRGR